MMNEEARAHLVMGKLPDGTPFTSVFGEFDLTTEEDRKAYRELALRRLRKENRTPHKFKHSHIKIDTSS